jgi:hypothetical protein
MPYATTVYTNADGADLTITKKGDELMSAKLGDEVLENISLDDNGNLVVDLGISQGEGGTAVSAKYVYTLNDDNTYSVEKVATPLVDSDNFTLAQGSTYSFAYDEANGTYTSNNVGVSSSSATMTITVNEAGAITFHYDVESEGGSYSIWDYLAITINNKPVTGLAEKLGGPDGGMTGDVVIAVNAGDVIKFEYKKDSSTNAGRDSAIISNLHFLVAAVA